MKRIAQVLSWLALAGTLLPPCLFFADRMTLESVRLWMLAAAALWFVATPVWMEVNGGQSSLLTQADGEGGEQSLGEGSANSED